MDKIIISKGIHLDKSFSFIAESEIAFYRKRSLTLEKLAKYLKENIEFLETTIIDFPTNNRIRKEGMDNKYTKLVPLTEEEIDKFWRAINS